VGTDKAPWEYADFASADRKLRAIAEDQGLKRDFLTYLQEASRELQVFAYHRSVVQLGRAQLAARFKEWCTRNRERFAQVQRKSYRRNYAKNYPRYLANARNRRARASLADGSHTSEEVRAMLRDQGGVCAYCRTALNGGYHVDHMVPLSRGGCNDWTNLAITCGRCNLAKGSMTVEEFLAGRSSSRTASRT
jgi:5-methylcytosine-specific restriction endonuclease McrA